MYCDGVLTIETLASTGNYASAYSNPAIATNRDGSIRPVEVPLCSGPWILEERRDDLGSVFDEFLSPDPEIIGLVMGSALVFWLIGHWLGRVMRVFRKVS